jgi:conjugal transfer pilus assembly protein TraE
MQVAQSRQMVADLGANKLMLIVSVVTNLMLILYMLAKTDTVTTHMVPPEISRSMWVSNNSASDTYLEDMTNFITQMVLNTSPTSVEYQGEKLKTLVCTQAVGTFDSLVKQNSIRLKRENAITMFAPRTFNVDRARMQVAALGDVTTYIGERKLSTVAKAYLLKFQNQAGKFCIKDLYETDSQDLFGDRAAVNPAAPAAAANKP